MNSYQVIYSLPLCTQSLFLFCLQLQLLAGVLALMVSRVLVAMSSLWSGVDVFIFPGSWVHYGVHVPSHLH